jgi:exopolyphosphatase / guanosine-5'-triphosphate,3'-diphosphate pyrophosphatase
VRLGVLDVGSNTVHLLLVDAHQGSAPVPASKLKMPLRMAEHLAADGTVDEAAVKELIAFIERGQQLAEDMGATELMAFATSAIRDAPNGDDVLTRIHDATNLRLLVVDIGGGSLELAAGDDEAPDVAVSLPLGAGRMTRQFLAHDPPSADEVRELRRHVRASIANVVGRVRRVGEPRIAAATSKTLRQLARIAGAAPSSDGIYVRRTLSRQALAELTPRLADMSAIQREALPGVSAARSRQLVAGAIVAEASMELLEIEELVICPWAMREGIILQRIDWLST